MAFVTFACGLSPLLEGFYDTGVWAPITLGLLAAVFGLVIARPAAPRRSAVVALAGLGALWLWSLISVAWAESAHNATINANRWLFYLALFTLLVLLLRNDRLARILFASLTASVLVVALYLVGSMLVGDGGSHFASGRLVDPIGYVNGQAGYFLLGVWPLVASAGWTRDRRLSAASIAGATLLGGLILLTQTRAAAIAFLLAVALLAIVLPERRRLLWVVVAVLTAVAAMSPLLSDVYSSVGADGLPDEGTLRSAALALVGVSAAAGVIWWGVATALDRKILRWPPARISGAALSRAGLATLAAVALALILIRVGDPVDQVRDEVNSFKNLDASEVAATGGSRFTTAGGNRYDYWRIALDEFGSAPLGGIGAGNYRRDYFVERRTLEDVTQPHSLEFQLLAELGVIGVIALCVFLAGVGAGLRRRLQAIRHRPGELGLVVAAAGVFVTWLLHTSADWLHEIPGVTGIALFGAAVLVSPWQRARGARAGRGHALAVGVCALVVAAGVMTVGRSALAESYRNDAEDHLASDPAAAVADANDSLELYDEALDTYYLKSGAYTRLGEYRRARRVLLEAAEREPHNYVTWALLGDLGKLMNDFWGAQAYYKQASSLNPRDEPLRNLAGDPFTYENLAAERRRNRREARRRERAKEGR